MATASKKKDSKPKLRSHPPYFEMISEAITTLKERSGSSQQAIQKFIENKYSDLPVNFRKLLLTSLKKFVADDKLVKVKASYKLPSLRSPAIKLDSSVAKSPAKKSSKSAPAKKTAAPAKVKAKPVAAKAKVKASEAKKTAEKVKVGTKRKTTEKKKEKNKAVAKVARTSTRSAPSRKAVVEKTSARSTPAKRAVVEKTSTRSNPEKKAVVVKKAAAKTLSRSTPAKVVVVTKKAPARGAKLKATRTSARKGKGKK